MACRSTVGHSTLTISDVSSSKLIKRRTRYPTRQVHLLSGPRSVRAEVKEDQADLLVRAMHDGYKDRFGFFHQRRLRLVGNGKVVEGVDQLACPPQGRPLTIKLMASHRFHLHPRGLTPSRRGGKHRHPDAAGCQSEVQGGGRACRHRESIFSPIRSSRKRCLQIVLRAHAPPSFRSLVAGKSNQLRDPLRGGLRGSRALIRSQPERA